MIDRNMLASALLIAAGTSLAAGAYADTRDTGETTTPGHTSGAEQSTSFEALDTNSDGYISESEAQMEPTLATQRQSLDDNGDGQIDRTEFAAFEGASAGHESSMGHEKEPMEPSDTEATDTTSDSDY